MKTLLKITLALFVAIPLLTACDDDPTDSSFGPSIESIEVGPEGGTETFTLHADGEWTASVSNDWIKITPTNGRRTTDITIRVDSTLMNDMRSDVIRFIRPGVIEEVRITQSGFGKEIAVFDESQKEVSLPDYEVAKNANFYVDVTSNVNFTVETGATWLKARTREVKAAAKAKPRTTRIYFDYDYNIDPNEQVTSIQFIPSDDDPQSVRSDEVLVVQDAAPVIEPGRQGDSIVVKTLFRILGTSLTNSGIDETKSMDYWESIELNEEGRVKSIYFYMIDFNNLFPYHIEFLTELETLEIWGGAGSAVYAARLGGQIAKLEKLTHLYLEACAITEIDDAIWTMSGLETLSLGHNYLYNIPDEINPVNFPNLKHLHLGGNQRWTVWDLSNMKYDISEIGPHGEFPRRFLEWEELETLYLYRNYFEGQIPDMLDHDKVWVRGDSEEWDEILDEKPELEGTIRVLPNCKYLRIQGNRLGGDLPDWMLDHPHLCSWAPYNFIFPMEGTDSNGKPARFDNIPDYLDCFLENVED